MTITFIAVALGVRSQKEVDRYRINGIVRGTIIRNNIGDEKVVIWNAPNSYVARDQMAILAEEEVQADLAKDFHQVGQLIEKYMA